MIVTLLPGVSVTYYGEELGMVNNDDITYEEGVDPQGCNYPPEQFHSRSRDFERTPMQWDGTVNAGNSQTPNECVLKEENLLLLGANSSRKSRNILQDSITVPNPGFPSTKTTSM